MKFSKYYRPGSVNDALSILASEAGNTHVLAGGTDLIPMMLSRRLTKTVALDIKYIPEMTRVDVNAEAVVIGAAASCAEVANVSLIKEHWQGLAQALDYIGSVQIRNRATIGGNLCNASPAADSAPALISAGASLSILGPSGARFVPAEQFFLGPRRTVLQSDELLVSIHLPRYATRSGHAFIRFTPRARMDIGVASAGVSVTVNPNGTIASARVSLGGVAPAPLLLSRASDAIVGTAMDGLVEHNLMDAVRADCDPISDRRGTREFRLHLAGVLTKRATHLALQRARR